ncbi:MAG: DNA polymerase III subunit gamma/tau [Bacillaceae bacterium]
MSYQALYRLWRPQQFSDVVGQEHVVKTLQNALLQQKVSHAYLFSGPRGTGKTSIAKIFAKAVNCEHAPTEEPCNECASCKGIMDGSISDVLEIDAASNNGVDEIRDIRDKVKFAPNAVKYKVYIIDEVHMLSIGAFNALLKTLEEPPPHVIFILATTEPHKIPLTIISRCQRYEFHKISLEKIMNRLQVVVESQGLTIEQEALQIIGRTAEGGMRDALSLLDQVISFSENVITTEDVLAVTGSISQQNLTMLMKCFQERNVSLGLKLIDEFISVGKDVARLVEDLIYYSRDMLLYKTSHELAHLLERVTVDEQFEELCANCTDRFLYETIEELSKSQQEMKWTNHPRILLEVMIVKLCELNTGMEQSQGANELLAKILYLEEELKKLKTDGVHVTSTSAPTPTKKDYKMQKPTMKVPVGRIQEILKHATRKDLDMIKRVWADLLDSLKRNNRASHAALLSSSEPVAATSHSFVLAFKYDIHCKMIVENNEAVYSIKQYLHQTLGKDYEFIPVPEVEWKKIREEFLSGEKQEVKQVEKDELVEKAMDLFGEQLVEIIE